MKQSLTLIAALLLSTSAFAANMTCENVDEYWEEDALEFTQEGKTTVAHYFDNDSWYGVDCETTMLDGYICEDEGFTITMYESGDTIVEYSSGETVDFMCY